MGMNSFPVELLCVNCMGHRENKTDPCPHCGFCEADYQAPLYHLPPRTILNGKYMVGRSIGEGGFLPRGGTNSSGRPGIWQSSIPSRALCG